MSMSRLTRLLTTVAPLAVALTTFTACGDSDPAGADGGDAGGGRGGSGGAGGGGGSGGSGGAGGSSGSGGSGGSGGSSGSGGSGGAGGSSGSGGSGGSGSGGSGTGGGSGGAGPDGGGGDGGPSNETPITARPSRGTYNCQIQRGITDHSPRSWRFPPALVKLPGGAAFLGRIESMFNPSMPGLPTSRLLVSTIDVAGAFGTPAVLQATGLDEAGTLAAAVRGDGLALVWVEGSKLRFAAVDAAGAVTVAPKDVLTGVDYNTRLQLATGSDGGFGLAYTPDLGGGIREVRFAVLDAAGGVRTPSRRLSANNQYGDPGVSVIAAPGGYALAWVAAGAAGGIDFSKTDLAGAELIAPRRISPPAGANVKVGGTAGFDATTTMLLPQADGYLAAWVEARTTFNNDAWAIVRLQRLDPAGARLGVAAALRAPVTSIDEVEPLLFPYGDAVAVLWSRGNHIYICGGCTPDNRLDLLLIDPVTLDPVSNVVSLLPPPPPAGERRGGLLRARTAVMGNAILTAYQLTFHVHATPGSAAFVCTR